jgi:hypothetical protein
MKIYIREHLGRFHVASFYFFIPAMILLLSLTATLSVAAGERVTFEGTVRGANCTHYNLECPDDEMHIAMENDFVLVVADGKHYFLPNLSRMIKARHANREVRISGEREDHEIWVETFEVKIGQSYKRVWSWEEQKKLYESAGG